MHRIVLSCVSLLTLCLTARAEMPDVSLPAPTLAETEQAEPDWYQQFTFSSNLNRAELEAGPLWQTQESQIFNLGWIKGDRWSLSLDLTAREEGSPLPREEMSAEAEFRITPRISVGGELRLGADELDDPGAWQKQQIEAGVRLRSAFKF